VYISGRALIILGDAQKILQTIYIDNGEALEAVTIEETTGRIATCDRRHVYIYKPIGRAEGVLRVCKCPWRTLSVAHTFIVDPSTRHSW
jgi:hypothetical protein